MTPLSLSRRLARLLRARFEAPLPADVADKMRLHVADTLGIALAASATPGLGAQVLAGLCAGGARGDAPVIGAQLSLPPASAAFANAASAHILDFDDIHDEARLHPTPVSLSAVLAVASLEGARGDRLVEAVTLGNELMCRLGVAVAPRGDGPGSDWFLTQLFGYLGACASASLLLDLDEDRFTAALGLAYMQAAGGKEAGFGVGSNARSIYPAFAAAGGVQAALLARAGMIGPETALDGAAGLFRIYLGAPPTPAQSERLLAAEGWAVRQISIKPWPSCRLSHPYVAAALDLRARAPAASVERVEILVNASAGKLCRPPERRRRPDTLQDAKYSIPFMVAFTLVHGEPTLRNLGEHALADEEVLALAARIDVSDGLPDNPGNPPAVVVVHRADGPPLRAQWSTSLDPDTAAVRKKFDDCLAYAGLQEHANALWQALTEEVPVVGVLWRTRSAAPSSASVCAVAPGVRMGSGLY